MRPSLPRLDVPSAPDKQDDDQHNDDDGDDDDHDDDHLVFVIKNLDDDETNSANYPKADQDEHLMMKMIESRMMTMIMRLMVMIMVLTPRMFSKPNVTGLFPSLSLQSWFVFPLRIKILPTMLL